MELQLIGERIKCLREDLEISVKEMAELCEMSEEEYLAQERGEADYTFSFLNRCANRFGVDLSEIITGSNSSHLKLYQVERRGKGLKVDRRKGYEYYHLASRFAGRKLEPFCVYVPFDKEAMTLPVKTNVHDGQEFDYIVEGSLKVVIGDKEEILNEGDSIIYDSSSPHGVLAASENGCKFVAILIK